MKNLIIYMVILLVTVGCAPSNKVRYPATRWVTDNDRKPIEIPSKRKQYTYSDAINYVLFYQLERLVDLELRAEHGLHAVGFSTLQEALNTNNFDEVADSTWFTNRLGRYEMTPSALRQGPNSSTGPNPSGPWTLVSAKKTGVSPGMVIEDQSGVKYFVKFDPPGHNGLASGADVIGTKIVYAMGYNVPETYIVSFHPKILNISPKATTKDKSGKDIPFTQKDLDELLKEVAVQENGEYRIVASKMIEGDAIGPISFRGKRKGDKNDHIPHEHRRELRGYRVVSALLSNSDTKQGNTYDTFIKTGPGDQGYVRHYMFDFSSTLGSASDEPKGKPHLDDYKFNQNKVAGSLFSLGVYQPDWERVKDPNIKSVGIFESQYFQPEKWRPSYPYPIFQNMTDRDGFWGAKILMRLKDEGVRAIVEEAKYPEPEATDYVTKTLIERRNKIGRYWFSRVNPLDDFQMSSSQGKTLIQFDDLMISSGLAQPGTATYRYRVIHEKGYELAPWQETSEKSAEVTAEVQQGMKSGKTYLLQLQTRRAGEEFWSPIVDVILQKKSAEVEMMGIQRRYRS